MSDKKYTPGITLGPTDLWDIRLPSEILVGDPSAVQSSRVLDPPKKEGVGVDPPEDLTRRIQEKVRDKWGGPEPEPELDPGEVGVPHLTDTNTGIIDDAGLGVLVHVEKMARIDANQRYCLTLRINAWKGRLQFSISDMQLHALVSSGGGARSRVLRAIMDTVMGTVSEAVRRGIENDLVRIMQNSKDSIFD